MSPRSDRESGISLGQVGLPTATTWIEMCPAGLIVVTSTGAIELANHAVESMLGYGFGELRGICCDELIPVAQRRRFAARRRLFFSDPARIDLGSNIEAEVRRRDGSELYVELALSPLHSLVGQPARAVVLVADITQRKNVEEEHARRRQELERSNAELEQFAYVASHDLREPLRMIASYTGLLGEHFEGKLDPRTERFMGYVREGAKRMQRLIDDLLAYSRLDARSQPRVPTRADDALQHALVDMRPLLCEVAAQITHDALPLLLVDPVQLDQLFQNIVHNAIKFRGNEPPRIHVSAERIEGMWRFAVQDNGIGIDEQYCTRIFQMFQRLHDRSKYDGSGIGLAIAKKIVDRHGGQIWVESKPGQGSTFYFTLPPISESHAA
jgi:PAS domain S-box-containing protein